MSMMPVEQMSATKNMMLRCCFNEKTLCDWLRRFNRFVNCITFNTKKYAPCASLTTFDKWSMKVSKPALAPVGKHVRPGLRVRQ